MIIAFIKSSHLCYETRVFLPIYSSLIIEMSQTLYIDTHCHRCEHEMGSRENIRISVNWFCIDIGLDVKYRWRHDVYRHQKIQTYFDLNFRFLVFHLVHLLNLRSRSYFLISFKKIGPFHLHEIIIDYSWRSLINMIIILGTILLNLSRWFDDSHFCHIWTYTYR